MAIRQPSWSGGDQVMQDDYYPFVYGRNHHMSHRALENVSCRLPKNTSRISYGTATEFYTQHWFSCLRPQDPLNKEIFPRIIRGNLLFLDIGISEKFKKNVCSWKMLITIHYLQLCWLMYIFNLMYMYPTIPQPHCHPSTSMEEVEKPLRCRWVINMHQ